MTALALRVEGRVVTHCCGGHRPAAGEASMCACCPECVTNALMSGFDGRARRMVARWVRALEVPQLLLRRAAYRRVEHALAVQELWDQVRAGGVRFEEYQSAHGRLT